MDITSLYSSTGTSLVASLYDEKTRNPLAGEQETTVSSWGMDCVTISSAAREKLAAASGEDAEKDGTKKEAFQEQTVATGGSASGGAGDVADDTQAKVAELKAKLASLQAMLGQASGSEAAQINAQISQVTAEIAALESA